MLKRKRDIDTNDVLQPKRISKDPSAKFKEILLKCGYIVSASDNANEIEVDQAVFLKELTKCLSSADVRSTFLEGLENQLEDEVRFKWSLFPTVTSISCKSARNACQDSLFHMLLSILNIQESVSKLLLEKLAEFAMCDSNEIMDSKEGKSLSCMILLQFRWLNELVNSPELAAQLFELVQETPIEVQRDIISLLPTILGETDHAGVASSLTKILQEKQELNVAILNTLSNLIIDSETLCDVRKEVLKTLTNAKLEDLPGIIRFVLMDLKPEYMEDTIEELRNNLEFTSHFDPVCSSTPLSSSSSSTPCIGTLIMNSVKLSLQVQKQLCNCWIKVLSNVCAPLKFKPFDVFVLLVLHSLVTHQKHVERLIRKKTVGGEINEDLLNKVFRLHHEILKEYVPALLKVCAFLLKATDVSVSLLAASLYVKTFIWFDVFTKQEVVGNLVTHVTNGTFLEKNAALDTLLTLVRNYAGKMLSLSVFIKGLIDFFDTLSLCQIRKIYEMLSFLCYWGRKEDMALEDDMHIVIRKQLMHKSSRYQKMGIIGALMAAKTACMKANEKESSEFCTNSEPDENDKCTESMSLLDLVQKNITNSAEAEALFYDELCRIISASQYTDPIEDWIDTHILASFEDSYVIEVSEDSPGVDNATFKFGLDVHSIALNLYAVLKRSTDKVVKEKYFFMKTPSQRISQVNKRKEQGGNSYKGISSLFQLYNNKVSKDVCHSSKPKEASYIVLVSMFRLLQVRKKKQDGSLSAIDALLGCPILVPELQHSNFALLPAQQKQVVLNIIFLCINWIREIINAFALADDKDTVLSVVHRLQLLVKLEELLCLYLQSVDNFVPPTVHFDSEGLAALCLKKPSKTKVKAKSKKKGKKTKSSDSSPDMSLQATLTNVSHSGDNIAPPDVEMKNKIKPKFSPYFREFDISVFKLYRHGVTFREACDPFSDEKERELALHSSELLVLLEDMIKKIKHVLGSSIPMRFKSIDTEVGFTNVDLSMNSDEFVSTCIEFFPHLPLILEESSNFFRNITSENDGIEDPLILDSDNIQQMLHCMTLIFKAFNLFLSWKGFYLVAYTSQLQKFLRIFACRERNVSEDVVVEDLVSYAVDYLAKFDDAVLSLSSASALIELLENVVSHTDQLEPKAQVSQLAISFLKKKWPELAKKGKTTETNNSVQLALEAYLKFSTDVLKSLEYLANEEVPKFMNDNRSTQSEIELKTLNKATLPSYCKIMLCSLVEERKKFYSIKREMQMDDIESWSRSIKIFRFLVDVIKVFDSRSVIQSSLLYGKQFLSLFLKHGMPLLDKCLTLKHEECISLLKNLQMSTRYMQHVCSHSKVLKDVVMMKQVPFVKKTLEQFVYRVKVMLAVNKCEGAFWVGNLKNRDLKGTEISSQVNWEDENESLCSSSGEEEEEHHNTNNGRYNNTTVPLHSPEGSVDEEDED